MVLAQGPLEGASWRLQVAGRHGSDAHDAPADSWPVAACRHQVPEPFSARSLKKALEWTNQWQIHSLNCKHCHQRAGSQWLASCQGLRTPTLLSCIDTEGRPPEAMASDATIRTAMLRRCIIASAILTP